MKRLHSLTVIALTGMVGFSSLCAPLAARASEDGKKNTAIGLGAAAVALLLTQKNKLPGLVAAGGAAYAYSQYEKDRRNNNRYGYRYGDRYNNDRRTNRDDYRNQDDRYRTDDPNYNNRYNDRYQTNDQYRSDRDDNRYRDEEQCRNDDRYQADDRYRNNRDDYRSYQDARSRDRSATTYNRASGRRTGYASSGR